MILKLRQCALHVQRAWTEKDRLQCSRYLRLVVVKSFEFRTFGDRSPQTWTCIDMSIE